MAAEPSAFAALGLAPGASQSQVDDAYRRLMKAHHPDRNGGDGRRAAEITHAYSLLRRDFADRRRRRAVPVPVTARKRRTARNRSGWLVVLIAGAAAAGIAARDDRGGSRGSPTRLYDPVAADNGRLVAAVPALGNFDEPLHDKVIDAAIRDALHFRTEGGMDAAVAYSRDCHSRIQRSPNLVLFDACAAFDESMIALGADSPPMEAGPFSGRAIIAREMAAARAVSDDMLGADSRLHQIRSRVEFALLPQLDAAASRPGL